MVFDKPFSEFFATLRQIIVGDFSKGLLLTLRFRFLIILECLQLFCFC